MKRTEDVVYEEWRLAQEHASKALLDELCRLFKAHALAMCWAELREYRPDIASDAVSRAILNIEGFKGNSKVSTWFHRIILNLIKSDQRKRAQLREDALGHNEPTSTAGIEVADAKMDLEFLSQSLTKGEIEFLQMKIEGLSEQEIKVKLGLTEEGVRSRWFRLRRKLQKRVA